MTTQIVATRLNGDDGLAMVETVSLTVLALVGLWLLRRTDAEEVVGGSKGTAPRPVPVTSRTLRGALTLLSVLLTVVLLLPHLTLLLVSFVPLGTWTTEALPPAYTTGNYMTLVQDPVRARPLVNSLWMATAATLASVAIAIAAAALTVRHRVRGAKAIEALLTIPWAVPGTVFAIAIAAAFSVRSPETLRFVLVGTAWILPMAYLVRNLPITGRAIIAGARRLDPSLEEAAATLGASRTRTLRRITLPLLRSAIVAGGTLAFVTAFGDFVTSIMLYTYDTRPVSLEILSSLRQSDVGVAAAYGVVLMAVSAVVFALGSERGSSG
jgi:iron(III) transport system permease protein